MNFINEWFSRISSWFEASTGVPDTGVVEPVKIDTEQALTLGNITVSAVALKQIQEAYELRDAYLAQQEYTVRPKDESDPV